jgi:hypothetical protein
MVGQFHLPVNYNLMLHNTSKQQNAKAEKEEDHYSKLCIFAKAKYFKSFRYKLFLKYMALDLNQAYKPHCF